MLGRETTTQAWGVGLFHPLGWAPSGFFYFCISFFVWELFSFSCFPTDLKVEGKSLYPLPMVHILPPLL